MIKRTDYADCSVITKSTFKVIPARSSNTPDIPLLPEMHITVKNTVTTKDGIIQVYDITDEFSLKMVGRSLGIETISSGVPIPGKIGSRIRNKSQDYMYIHGVAGPDIIMLMDTIEPTEDEKRNGWLFTSRVSQMVYAIGELELHRLGVPFQTFEDTSALSEYVTHLMYAYNYPGRGPITILNNIPFEFEKYDENKYNHNMKTITTRA